MATPRPWQPPSPPYRPWTIRARTARPTVPAARQEAHGAPQDRPLPEDTDEKFTAWAQARYHAGTLPTARTPYRGSPRHDGVDYPYGYADDHFERLARVRGSVTA